VSTFLELAQILQMAVKALQMYTAAHPRSQEALGTLTAAVNGWLQDRPELQMAASAGKVFVDGAPVEGSSLHLTALVRQLSERQISGFVLQRGVPAEELLAMLEILILKPAKLEEQGGVAKVMASRNLRYIALSQTQYREVREGSGDDDKEGEPAGRGAGSGEPSASLFPAGGPRGGALRDEAAPEPLAFDLAEALDHWRQHLMASLHGLTLAPQEGFLGFIPAASLAGLGVGAQEAGWGPGFPTAVQMESLRQALKSLPGERQLAILKGLDSLPLAPASLHMGFQALAPEVLAQASTDLLGRGFAWQDLKESLYELISVSPQRQAMLAGLEAVLRTQGAPFGDLLRQLDWDNQSTDEKLRRATEEGRLWDLSLEQRLAFLRELLKTGRTEPFLRILEIILDTLTHEDAPAREGAAQTLAGLCHWTCEPDFPLEAEGPILDGLKGHFGWEPIPHIHRSTEESLEALLHCFLGRGELAHAQGLVQELQGLLAFLEDPQEWRGKALERLVGRLAAREAVARAVEALHGAEAEALHTVFVPYFETLGEACTPGLVQLLGEEPDRKRRGRLLELIRALGRLALGALQEALRSPTWYLVRNTLNLMADLGDAGMLGDVAQCLQHGDGRVRRAAVRTLWKLGGPACAGHLLPIFPATDPETQVEILFGLGQVQSGLAVFVLGDFAKNPQVHEKLRVKTVETLGQIGHPSAIPSLADLLRRKGRIFSTAEPTELRLAAARALVAIDTREALEILQKLVEDEPRSKDRDALQQILDNPRRPQGAP
jgi:HEAT repeat protein